MEPTISHHKTEVIQTWNEGGVYFTLTGPGVTESATGMRLWTITAYANGLDVVDWLEWCADGVELTPVHETTRAMLNCVLYRIQRQIREIAHRINAAQIIPRIIISEEKPG